VHNSVSGVFPLTEWRAAFDAFEQKSGLKSVLQPVGEIATGGTLASI
jgi:hypothetical protein